MKISTQQFHPLHPIPLSLYIHFPWCVRKCPYCDFTSYPCTSSRAPFNADSENIYIKALLEDLRLEQELLLRLRSGTHDKTAYNNKIPIYSVYIGGGTPTLLSIAALNNLMAGVRSTCQINPNAEITIEANPETITHDYCTALYACCGGGINRISIGAQSFQDRKLAALGRIHNAQRARHAVELAHTAGFGNINIDLMFGLPEQSVSEALEDLHTAISLEPTHISWYQLTIEAGTAFARQPPRALPRDDDDVLWQMQQEGQALLANAGFVQYEVSAYSKPGKECQHNVNYWQFGDYLGIGAGAHGKLTVSDKENKENGQDGENIKDGQDGEDGQAEENENKDDGKTNDKNNDVNKDANLTILRYNKISSPQLYCCANDGGSSNNINSCNDKKNINNNIVNNAGRNIDSNNIIRHSNPFAAETHIVDAGALPFEFMLNALRLYQPLPSQLFAERTGMPPATIDARLQHAAALGLVELTSSNIIITTKGKNFLNDLIELFL